LNRTNDGRRTEETLSLLEKIEYALKDVEFGTVTVIYQDGKAIQLEKQQKIRLDQGRNMVQQTQQMDNADLRKRFQLVARGLKFGKIALEIRNGSIIQIERTDKIRFIAVEGSYGDGI
jgi:hypothetical protein